MTFLSPVKACAQVRDLCCVRLTHEAGSESKSRRFSPFMAAEGLGTDEARALFAALQTPGVPGVGAPGAPLGSVSAR